MFLNDMSFEIRVGIVISSGDWKRSPGSLIGLPIRAAFPAVTKGYAIPVFMYMRRFSVGRASTVREAPAVGKRRVSFSSSLKTLSLLNVVRVVRDKSKVPPIFTEPVSKRTPRARSVLGAATFSISIMPSSSLKKKSSSEKSCANKSPTQRKVIMDKRILRTAVL